MGWTRLIRAAWDGVGTMMSAGAWCSAWQASVYAGRTAMMIAARCGHENILHLLRDVGAEEKKYPACYLREVTPADLRMPSWWS